MSFSINALHISSRSSRTHFCVQILFFLISPCLQEHSRWVCYPPPARLGAPPAPPQLLALDVSKVPLIFWRWAIAPKKEEKQQNIFMFGLARFEFRKMFTTWRFFSPRDANLRHRRCRAGGSWRGPSLAPFPGGDAQQGWPHLSGVSVCPEELIPPNPFGKENLAWAAGLLRLVPSPEPPPTVTGIVHEPQFYGKDPVGQLGLSCAGRYDPV